MTRAVETLQNRFISENKATKLPIAEAIPLIPWEFIWKSGIPPEVIFGTAGRFFDHLAARESLMLRGEDEASIHWYSQSKNRLFKYLCTEPLARKVYASLQHTSYYTTIQIVRENETKSLL